MTVNEALIKVSRGMEHTCPPNHSLCQRHWGIHHPDRCQLQSEKRVSTAMLLKRINSNTRKELLLSVQVGKTQNTPTRTSKTDAVETKLWGYVSTKIAQEVGETLTLSKISRTLASDSPNHMVSNSGPLMEMKFAWHSLAMALASSVLPQPGGP